MKDELSKQIISTVRQFVKKDVAPTVHELEDKDKKDYAIKEKVIDKIFK